MKKIIIGLAICGVVSYGLIQHFNAAIPRNEPLTLNIDHRIPALEEFMLKQKCPTPYYIKEYLNAADEYKIDYRVLPSISIIESRCGRQYPQGSNNLWGWASARSGFSSISNGINFINQQLAQGKYYKDKTLKGKLKAYNSVNPQYYNEVTNLIDQMPDIVPYQIKI